MTQPSLGSLAGKTFLVVGAAGQVAGFINAALLAAGANLVLAARGKEAAQAAVALTPVPGVSVTPVEGDVSTIAGARAMVEATLQATGSLHGVISTVGGFSSGPAADLTPEEFERLWRMNTLTMVNVTLAALPALLAEPGRFLGFISAGQAWRGEGARAAAYTSSKAAAGAFLRSVAAEHPALRGGIVYPLGAIDTPANHKAMPNADVTTWIDPREIGEAFVFMASRGRGGTVQEVVLHAPGG